MIKRINLIKNIGRFEYLQSDRGNEGDFKELNIIYALNACGKSTLCDILRSLSKNDPSYILGRQRLGAGESPEAIIKLDDVAGSAIRFDRSIWHNAGLCAPIYVFDERFVSENVLVGHQIHSDHRKNIYGLVIGERAIQLQQGVAQAEVRLREATNDLGRKEGVLLGLIPEGWNISRIRALSLVENIDQEVQDSERVLRNAEQAQSNADAIRRRQELSEIQIPITPGTLSEILAESLDQAALTAEERVREHLAQHSDGLEVEWVKTGYRAKNTDACPMCGQNMDGLDILEAYKSLFSGALREQEQRRAAYGRNNEVELGSDARNRIRRQLEVHQTEQTWWAEVANTQIHLPSIGDLDSIIDRFRAAHTKVAAALLRKQASPATSLQLIEEEEEALEGFLSACDELRTYNRGLAAVNQLIGQKKSEVGNTDLAQLKRRVDELKATKKRHEPVFVTALSEYDVATQAKVDAQRAKTEANNALRDQSNQLLERYGNRINQLLSAFACNFSVVSNGVDFRGNGPSGRLGIQISGVQIDADAASAANPARPSLSNTISGGDRSALAFAFFIAMVEQDANLGNAIVVFDDPYHNQDRSRRQRTIQHVQRLARSAKQCFLMSHDLDFARAVERVHEIDCRTFVLEALDDRTNLEATSLPALPSRAYETSYKLLQDYIGDPAQYRDQMPNVAKTLRTILEEYLHLKFPLRWEEHGDWLGVMIGKIRDASGDDPLVSAANFVQNLTDVNDYSQRFHHRSTGATGDIPDSRELITYAQQVLSIIHQ